MIIHRVHVRKFRKLADQVLDCGPGVNVIRGPNDAGKSTLHEAFSAALFPIRPSETAGILPWGDDRPGEITMEFASDGERYRLHKDFGARTVLLEGGGRRWETPKAVEAEIGRILGLTSLSLFRATAHIAQWELAAVQDEREAIGARLSQIMTGGDSDASRVLKDLKERIDGLEVGLRRPAKRPGPLRQQSELIARLTETRSRLESEVAAIEQAAVERDRLAVRIAELRAQLAGQGALLNANRQLFDLDRQWEDLRRRAGELQSLVERIDVAARDLEAAGRDEALRFAPIDPAAIRTLRELAMRVELLQRDVARRPRHEEAHAHGADARAAPGLWLKRRRQFLWTAVAAGATALGVLGWTVALAVRGQATAAETGFFVFIASLAATIGALSAMAASLARRQSAMESETEAWARRRMAEEETAARRSELAEVRAELDRRLGALGAATVQEAVDRQERLEQARRRVDGCQRVLETVLSGRSRDSVEQERSRVLVDLGAAQARRDDPDLALKRLDPASLQRLQDDVDRGARDLEAANARFQQLEGRLGERSPYEELARVEEELTDARDRLLRLERQSEVLKLTYAVLFEAHRHTIVPGKERLEQLASGYLRALSDGRYTRIEVDAHTLAPRVWVGPPKPDGWANVERREIGSGAVDQCYLALRLGLVDVLCQDRRPPLFLDDPLLAYDENRQASAMGLLREIGRERQIFLFTCRSAYDPFADRVLVLADIRVVAS